MNSREKFHALMNFEKGTPAPKVEYGYWVGTIRRFIAEGMPVIAELPDNISENGSIMGYEKTNPLGSEVADKNVRSYFNLDSHISKFPIDASPLLDEKVIEENEDTRIYIDKYGITKKERKDTTATPLEIARPVKDRADFEKYKSYYDHDYSKRLPENWPSLSKKLGSRNFPIRVGGYPYGFFGLPRHLMGDVELMMTMYDDPHLIKDMNEFFLDFIMGYWAHIFETFVPDCCLIWEDMCFKGAAMISGPMFEEFLTPYYIKIVDFLQQYGINIILVDSDGYVEELIPLWRKAGVTGLLPFEIQAGNDLLRIRENFPRLQMLGGIDKIVLQKDRTKSDIDMELKKVKILLAQGGYIPHIDHHVSQDASWKNFKYYRKNLNDIINSAST